MAGYSKEDLVQLVKRFGAYLTLRLSDLFKNLDSWSVGGLAGLAIAILFIWRLWRPRSVTQRRQPKRRAPTPGSSGASNRSDANLISSGVSTSEEDSRAQNVIDEFFQPVKLTLGQVVRQKLSEGRKVTCRLLGVVLEETSPEELQTKVTVRSSVLEVLLEITKFCDVYLMERVSDDKMVLSALEDAGVFTSGGLVKDKVLFCSTENGRTSFVRQLEPDWHIDTNPDIIFQLAESCQEVKAVIGFAKPQVVFLELCPSRKAVLFPQNLKVPTMRDMVEMWWTQHDIFGILYSWFLAKVASKLEVCPGSEFRVACEEALKYDDNVQVKLGDRPVQITLQRTWAKMPLWHKTKLLYSVVFQAFFLPSSEDLNKMLKEMDNVDMLTRVIQDMSKKFPTLMETLVHERDQYMSATLLEVARTHSPIVAVVGKGHLEGIKKYWKQSVELEHLEHVDMTSRRLAISAVKLLTTVGVAVAGVAMISGLRGGWLFQQ